jgi:hypothetical protein
MVGIRTGCIMLGAIMLFAFKSSSQAIEIGSWNVLNIKYNHSKELSFFGEGQLRSLKLYDDFHYHESKGGINYKFSKSIMLTLAAGSYQTYKEGGDFKTPKNNDEFRLWPQVTLFQEINKVKIEQRYRAEMRWTINGYRNRFRYRLGANYPFGKEKKGYKPFLVSMSNELFFTDVAPYFERNRIQMNFNYKISKISSIQFGYLHQFDYKINDETGRDFLVVGFFKEINRNTAIKK